MLFLSKQDAEQWLEMGKRVELNQLGPKDVADLFRPHLLPIFYCYAGSLLAAKGREESGKEWFRAGAQLEEEGLFFNVFLTSFLERQNNRLIMPAVAFEDPRPYVHFTGVPALKDSRKSFIKSLAHSLPRYSRPVKIMDLGCGNGALLVDLLVHLQETDSVRDITEIVLVDPSPAMLELARETVSRKFSAHTIRTVNSRIEAFTANLDTHVDIALSSLAFHHMPLEKKQKHLQELRPWFDHFVLFEVDANNETPQLFSPELIISLYQSFGRLIDFVFAHDAPLDVAYHCVDCFLMVEVVSFLTQPHGLRTDYHMMQKQWQELFELSLGNEFSCYCQTNCYSDEYFNIFMMHYGR